MQYALLYVTYIIFSNKYNTPVKNWKKPVLTKFKVPMQGHCRSLTWMKCQWISTWMNLTALRANVELMIWRESRLKDDERAEQGLPITPAVDTGGARTSARCRVIAQTRAWRAAAVDAAAAKAARAGALRAHTRTHIHSLCRRRRNVLGICLARILWAFT